MTTSQLRESLKGLTKKQLESQYAELTGSTLKFKTKQLSLDAIISIYRARQTGEAFSRMR